jgi:hypothetical protein
MIVEKIMASYAQVYATVGELIGDLRLSGDETGLLDRIREASRLISNRLGEFIPITETRTFDPDSTGNLRVDPLLAASAVLNDGAAVTDYKLMPRNRLWLNGPYTSLVYNSGTWSSEGVQITGRYGKFENSASLSVAAGDTTLAVSDGSQISPGMVVMVEAEQQLALAGNGGEGSPAATTATSKLNGAITADDEEITVDNGAEFKRGEVIQLSTEDCLIRRISGHVLVCSRGWNGTTKAAHANDLAIGVYRTFTVERGVNGTTAAAHTSKLVTRVQAPEDINWLCRQVAGLMRMKAAAGFASKTGNAELGETFYYSEFPAAFARLWESYKLR